MNLFGLELSRTNLLGIAGALIMLLLGVYVPAAYKRRTEAASNYCRAFDDALLNLREYPDCTIANIAISFHPQHLVAIDRYRASIPFWKRRRFEKDVAHYKVAYDIARDYGNVFAVALSEETDVARARRRQYSVAIQRLLSYA